MQYSQMTRKRGKPPEFRRLAKQWLHKNILYIFLACAFLLGVAIGSTVACALLQSSDDREVLTLIKDYEASNYVSTVTVIKTTNEEPAGDDDPNCGWYPFEDDVAMLAKLIWGEARGVKSTTEKAAVVWCVLNRVDSQYFPDTIAEVVTQRCQFAGYNYGYPVTEEFADIARDVLVRWHAEKESGIDAGRCLPKEFLYFTGDGTRNYFTKEWGKASEPYGWTDLLSPYDD